MTISVFLCRPIYKYLKEALTAYPHDPHTHNKVLASSKFHISVRGRVMT